MSGATLVIQPELMRRLDTLARRTRLTTPALAPLVLEAAVNRAEPQLAREQRVAQDLEAVLVRAILRGDYDPATSVGHERSGRSNPPGEAQDSLTTAAAPGAAGNEGQLPLDRGRL